MGQDKNYIIQLLRFLFVLIIVTYNFPIDSILYKNLIIKNINLFITFFFVLSSYLFFLKFNTEKINLDFIIDYLKTKILRFYPIHFLLLICFGVIEIVKNFYIIDYNYNPIYQSYSLNEFILNLFFLNGFELSPHTFNQPSWTISLLIGTILFYTIFNLIDKKLSVFLSILLSIFLTFIIVTNYSYEFMYKYRNLLLLLSFSTTQVLCYLLFNTKILRKWSVFVYALFSILTVFLFYFFRDLSTIFLYFILIFFLFKNNKKLELSNLKKFCIYLGNISFIWFMSHYLFTFLTRQVLKVVYKFKINLNDNTIIFEYGSSLVVLFVIFTSLIFSIFLYEMNKRILKFKKLYDF